MDITWESFRTAAGQLAFLVALTGLVYRVLRLFFADVPEAAMQFLAAIFSTVTALATTYDPSKPKHQWLLIGVAAGVLMSQNVVKSIDWISAAKTQTGAPSIGLPEQPPKWYQAAHPELYPPKDKEPDAPKGGL